ncbi:uncharacterized protein LOC18446659 isoform X3 [Amborella trichopoda]|uniref:uncharacterized protein LOC18446659 isoform X3 n=1 Tax=Amborella trichopoda TaxID=13333 RepID=UPI0009BF0F3C|nr:uncharacterized protein LOC18446659 isoform X3 [Amborella trichopoda]|eukprot:XP_006856832.3 uncharacterized protein LOC18446659 isoform X3 [Amborella trichopoda]
MNSLRISFSKTPILSLSKTPITQGGDEIYVASMPLRAPRGPPQLIMAAAYSLNSWNLQHFMVILKPASPSSQLIVCDFQPEDPEDVKISFAALSGRTIPGIVLVRKLTKLPKSGCWYVGSSDDPCIHKVRNFNNCWDTELKIWEHDCRHYTNGLVEYLTGEHNVLGRLRGGWLR